MIHKSITAYVGLELDELLSDLQKGMFLLLFDGLDEIKLDLQAEFMDELSSLASRYDKNYFVTTCRPSEIMVRQFGFKKIILEGLTKERAIKMINKIPGYDEKLKTGFIEDFKQEWNRYKTICENPLLLNIMFLIYKDKNKKFPTKIYEFYDSAYDVMYEKHNLIQNHKREYKTKLTKNQLKNVISEFCYLLYQDGDIDFTFRYAKKIFAMFKQKVGN